MLKKIVIAGRTLDQSDPQPATVTFTLEETDHPAQRTTLAGEAVLLEDIEVTCECSGTVDGNTYVGKGRAAITAQSPRITCEGNELLLVGDAVKVNCIGTSTAANGTTIGGVAASVSVAISEAGQTTGLANDN